MNTTELKTNWKEITGKLKQRYGNLTDDDLMFADGLSDEMLARLERKLSRSKETIRTEIMELANSLHKTGSTTK